MDQQFARFLFLEGQGECDALLLGSHRLVSGGVLTFQGALHAPLLT